MYQVFWRMETDIKNIKPLTLCFASVIESTHLDHRGCTQIIIGDPWMPPRLSWVTAGCHQRNHPWNPQSTRNDPWPPRNPPLRTPQPQRPETQHSDIFNFSAYCDGASNSSLLYLFYFKAITPRWSNFRRQSQIAFSVNLARSPLLRERSLLIFVSNDQNTSSWAIAWVNNQDRCKWLHQTMRNNKINVIVEPMLEKQTDLTRPHLKIALRLPGKARYRWTWPTPGEP